MARFALITFPGGGNLPPLMRLAAELIARGHEVHVLAAQDVGPAASATGASFVPLPEQDFWTWSEPRSVRATLMQAVRQQTDRPLERRILEELDRLQPAAVLVDCLLSGCARRASDAGYPTVVLFHTYLDYWMKNLARGPVGCLSALHGRSLRRSWAVADLRIVMCDEPLDPSARPRSATVWAGSGENGVASHPQDPPLVVVSLSTAELPGQRDAYHRITTALGSLPVQAIITVGTAHPEQVHAASNVDVRGYAPHADLFPHASLVISHGGLSTAFRALAHGVPLLLMPMNRLLDQPMVAESIRDAGAARVIARSAAPSAIAAEVTEMLRTPSFTAAAAAIGERLRSTDGAARAADAVLKLLRNGPSIPPRTRTPVR